MKINPAGFYKLNGFGSRCFLIDRRRFGNLLPMRVSWAQRQGRIRDRLPRKIVEKANFITGFGLLGTWEKMIADAMKEKSFMRADIGNNKALTIHPVRHGSAFIAALPKIIDKVEKGEYPPEQLGKYDLELKYWMNAE